MILQEGGDPYQSFKRGVRTDIMGGLTGLVGGLGVFFLIVFLVMLLRQAIVAHSTICGFAFAVLLLGLVFKQTSNWIITIWGVLIITLLGSAILIAVGYFVYICLSIAFQ